MSNQDEKQVVTGTGHIKLNPFKVYNTLEQHKAIYDAFLRDLNGLMRHYGVTLVPMEGWVETEPIQSGEMETHSFQAKARKRDGGFCVLEWKENSPEKTDD